MADIFNIAQHSRPGIGGGDPDAIAEAAAAVGYDVSPVRPAMDMFAARAAE